jgi:hypothetical protein
MLSLSCLLAVSFGAGIAFHLITLQQELDHHVHHLFGGYLITFSGLIYIFHQSTHDFWAAFQVTGLIAAVFNTALTASILTYRLFFHRLHRFPGPKLAKSSKLWWFFKLVKQPKGYLMIEQLHKQYGDWVRTG